MPRIEIRRSGNGIAILICFDSDADKFDSDYERTKFFRGLYGWNQVIRKGESVYEYHREGLLNEIPHIKVESSAFIVALKEMRRILDYFDEWSDKVTWRTFKVLLDAKDKKLLEVVEE